MIVYRGPQVRHELFGLKRAKDSKFDKAHKAVDQQHYAARNGEQSVAHAQEDEAQKQPYRSGTRVSHEHGAGLAVEYQVGEQHGCKYGAGHYHLALGAQDVSRRDGSDHGIDHQSGGQSVYSVRAVHGVYHEPEERSRKDNVQRLGHRNGYRAVVQHGCLRFEVHQRTCHKQADDEVHYALLKLAPGSLRTVVQIAGQHGQQHQHHVDDHLDLEAADRRCNHREHRHHKDAGAAYLAFGLFAGDREFPAVVPGQLRPYQLDEQYGQHEGRQAAREHYYHSVCGRFRHISIPPGIMIDLLYHFSYSDSSL